MGSEVPEHTVLPYVAVIIPVYNDSSRLSTCLRALDGQTYPRDRYEVVVVDNGSSDDVAEVCRTYAHVRCLYEPTPGSYAARNKGLANTNAEVLAFTDSDCIPHRDWLEMGVACLNAPPACDSVGGNVIVFPKDRARMTAAELFESAFAFPQKQRIEDRHWSVTANLFARRSLFEAIGPFSGVLRSGGDKEWGMRAHAAGYRIAFAEDARVDHPARANIDELLTKARRVGGGKHMSMLGREPSNGSLARFLLRAVYYGLRNTVRVLRGQTTNYAELRHYSLRERVVIAYVMNLFTISRLKEIVTLRLTMRPASRG